jgi:ribosomal subunit interface protein
MTNIKATNIEMTDELHDYIEKKLSAARKFVKQESVERIYVDVAKSTNHHKQGDIYKAEFNVVIDGTKFNAASETEDIYASIDDAASELVRQITEKKDHQISVFRRGARSVKKMLKGLSKRNPFTSKVGERIEE